jgi:hypothetical protein
MHQLSNKVAPVSVVLGGVHVSGSKELLVGVNVLPATLSLACLSSEFLQCIMSCVARFEGLVIFLI